jgi:hypothetical protein
LSLFDTCHRNRYATEGESADMTRRALFMRERAERERERERDGGRREYVCIRRLYFILFIIF